MKIILSIIFCLLALMGYSQTTTGDVERSEYKEVATDSRSWAFTFSKDTLSAKAGSTNDTIGAHIFNYPDTVFLYLPNTLGDGFVGVVTTNMDTIGAKTALQGTYAIQSAQCLSGCPWTTEVSAALPAVSANTRSLFEARDLKLRVMIIATTGIGGVNGWLTLKQASITKS